MSCKCDLRTRAVGDGCRYCNPQEYIDKLHEQDADYKAEIATLEQQLRNLLALVEKKNEALHEVRQVFETPDHPGISDTVWVVGNRPETLYDCTLAAIDLTADDVELVEVAEMRNGEWVSGYFARDLTAKLYKIQMKGK